MIFFSLLAFFLAAQVIRKVCFAYFSGIVGLDVNFVVAMYTQACKDLTCQNFVDSLFDSCRRRLSLQSRNEWLQWPS